MQTEDVSILELVNDTDAHADSESVTVTVAELRQHHQNIEQAANDAIEEALAEHAQSAFTQALASISSSLVSIDATLKETASKGAASG